MIKLTLDTFYVVLTDIHEIIDSLPTGISPSTLARGKVWSKRQINPLVQCVWQTESRTRTSMVYMHIG